MLYHSGSHAREKGNNLHTLYLPTSFFLFRSTKSIKYVPNSKGPIIVSFVAVSNYTGAHLDILILFITDHDLDKEIFGPRWNRFLANVLDQFAHLHRHSISGLYESAAITLCAGSPNGHTFFGATKEDHNMETPCETICTSSLCSFLKKSMNSCRVGLFGNSNRSQRVHSVSPYYQ